jgi:hypothetical protein
MSDDISLGRVNQLSITPAVGERRIRLFREKAFVPLYQSYIFSPGGANIEQTCGSPRFWNEGIASVVTFGALLQPLAYQIPALRRICI